MRSSGIVTLFAESPQPRRAPSSFTLSILLHGAVLTLLYLGLTHSPRILDRPADERFTVRLMNLRSPDPPRATHGSVAYRGMQAAGANAGSPAASQARSQAASPAASQAGSPARTQALSQAGPEAVAPAAAPSGGNPGSSPSVPLQMAHLVPAPQTLVQPDLPPNLPLPRQIPIPAVLLWSAENVPTRKIVPPPPREVATANLRPSLRAPNHEVKPADLKLSATAFPSQAPVLPPSTTSPVVLHQAEAAKRVPETASKAAGPPTPAAVLSISDLQMKDGAVALPPANQTAAGSPTGLLLPGHAQGTSGAGDGNTAGRGNGKGTGDKSGDQKGAGGPAAQNGTGPAGQTGGQGQGGGQNGGGQGGSGGGQGQNGGGQNGGGKTGTGSGQEGTGSVPVNDPAYDRVSLPKTGKFGVVVVQSSLADEYPETVPLAIHSLAYTVFVHVGLARNWTLQYSLPREVEAAAGVNATRPEAPWPYLIVRPHFAPGDSNADAIMVHGFVNAAGRFEKLAVVFPAQFAQTEFVLNALKQWQFRAATQHGEITAVEVLLIIPQQPE